MKKQLLLVFGPQGSGKGTQGIKLSEHYAIPHISTGDIFRYEIEQESEIGKAVKDLLDTGKLVPDEIVNKIVSKRLSQEDVIHGCILDGYPRNTTQVDFLLDLIQDHDYENIFVINLEVSDEESIKRLEERMREDDTSELIKERLRIYHEQTRPVLDYFKSKEQVTILPINGEQSIDGVSHEILKKLGEE